MEGKRSPKSQQNGRTSADSMQPKSRDHAAVAEREAQVYGPEVAGLDVKRIQAVKAAHTEQAARLLHTVTSTHRDSLEPLLQEAHNAGIVLRPEERVATQKIHDAMGQARLHHARLASELEGHVRGYEDEIRGTIVPLGREEDDYTHDETVDDLNREAPSDASRTRRRIPIIEGNAQDITESLRHDAESRDAGSSESQEALGMLYNEYDELDADATHYSEFAEPTEVADDIGDTIPENGAYISEEHQADRVAQALFAAGQKLVEAEKLYLRAVPGRIANFFRPKKAEERRQAAEVFLKHVATEYAKALDDVSDFITEMSKTEYTEDQRKYLVSNPELIRAALRDLTEELDREMEENKETADYRATIRKKADYSQLLDEHQHFTRWNEIIEDFQARASTRGKEMIDESTERMVRARRAAGIPDEGLREMYERPKHQSESEAETYVGEETVVRAVPGDVQSEYDADSELDFIEPSTEELMAIEAEPNTYSIGNTDADREVYEEEAAAK
jgi:hypothetical protein